MRGRVYLVSYCPPSARKGVLIVEEFECPICLLDECMEFKRKLGWTNAGPNFFRANGVRNFILQGIEPGFREAGNLISNRTWTAVELRRGSSEEASPPKYDSFNIANPRLQHRSQAHHPP